MDMVQGQRRYEERVRKVGTAIVWLTLRMFHGDNYELRDPEAFASDKFPAPGPI
jgi:hypothetical protein